MRTPSTGPTSERERHIILDVLRGFALLGIALANYPEFTLWTFLSLEQQEALPYSAADKTIRFLQYMFVDGKFYTIFSILFGIGFSLILSRHSVMLFFRRMVILAVIGFCHLMFLWSGDILLLYAIGGMLLALFARCNDRVLLVMVAALIIIPVGLAAITEHVGIDFAAPFYQAWWYQATAHGITEENFAFFLRDADTYPQMFAFLIQGACERMWEFVEGHRLPKVLGLFILGYMIGKHRLYARLSQLPLAKCQAWCYGIGIPTSALYAWSATHGHPWGATSHAMLYAISVLPLAFAFITSLCLIHQKGCLQNVLKMLAAPGRMALTNYISQSIFGILLFYGVGFGWGASASLAVAELTAITVFLLQVMLSSLWLRHFHFGPAEWIWRLLTYGRYFPIRK